MTRKQDRAARERLIAGFTVVDTDGKVIQAGPHRSRKQKLRDRKSKAAKRFLRRLLSR